MTTTAEPEFLTMVLAEIAEPLYASLDRAVEIARSHVEGHGMTHPLYAACRSHLARAHARHELVALEESGEIGRWLVAPPAPNVQVCLNRDQLQLRLLRPDRTQVPKPGTNATRIAWFSNRHATLAGIEASRLIGLWAPDDDDMVVVRVVRTVGEARWGQRNTIDLDITVPRGAPAVRELEFRPMDDREIELPFERGDAEPDQQNPGES